MLFFFPVSQEEILKKIDDLAIELRSWEESLHANETRPEGCCSSLRSTVDGLRSDIEELRRVSRRGGSAIREYTENRRQAFHDLFTGANSEEGNPLLASGSISEWDYIGILSMNALCACFIAKNGVVQENIRDADMMFPDAHFVERTLINAFARMKAPRDMVERMCRECENRAWYAMEFKELTARFHHAEAVGSILVYNMENRTFHMLADLMS